MAWLSGYSKRKKLTVAASTHITANLTDQVAVLNIASGSDFWTNNPPVAGGGVRITTSDGATLCTFQVESYDTTGDDGWWHIKIPTLSATVDTILYIYFDAITETDGSDKQATWDTSYKMVHHFNVDQTEGAFDDATINNNDGTATGTADVVSRVDKARSFNGTSDHIAVSDSTSLRPASFCVEGTFTPSVDFPIGGGTTDIQTIFDHSGAPGGFTVQIDDTEGKLHCWFYTGSWQVGKSTTASWTSGVTYHFAAVYDGTDIRIYIDGTLQTTTAVTGTLIYDTTTAQIGRYSGGADRYFTGTIEELTVSTSRSADWVSARYQSGLGTWLTISALESEPAITPIIGTFTVPSPTITGKAVVSPTPIIGAFTIPAPAVFTGMTVRPAPITASFTIPAHVVVIPVTITVTPITGTFTIPAPIVTISGWLFGVEGFPQSVTVEYRIKDEIGALIQDWTSVGVVEDAGPNNSAYSVVTPLVDATSQGKIYWRTSDLLNEASETFNYHRYADNMRGTDNTPTLSEIEASTVLAKEVTLQDVHDEALGKWVVDPTAKTLTLYKADGVTVLKVFDLGSTTATVPNFISRTPQ